MEAQASLTPAKGEEVLLSECYVTIQGESSLVGLPTVFVRLYTCNLRCAWCDSMHAVESGDFTKVRVDDLVGKIQELAGRPEGRFGGIRYVCWTGGEPLLQGEAIARAIRQLPRTFIHSIETDGEIDLGPFDAKVPEERASGRVRYVMDIKCPGSTMVAKKAFANLGRLRPHDEVKFVLLDRADYDFAKDVLAKHPTPAGTILFSPVNPAHHIKKGLDSERLADWLKEDGLAVRLQIQLHKVLWPGRDRGI
jgi:7-carboxy-7-deazaguanine synthase